MMRYRTLNEVAAGLAQLEHDFRQRRDRRAVFATLYGVVSSEMRDRVARGAFEDPGWVERYAVTFANLYVTALAAQDAGLVAQVPGAWRLCFERARASKGLVLQDMLLGINAHVNHDLPFALHGISIEPDRAARYRDHAAVNAVLASVTERATARLAALYAPGLTGMDECAGALDELAAAFSLEVARESAWESAVALANARDGREHRLVSTLIGSRATVVARLLVASAPPPLMVACARLEEGSGWIALADTIKMLPR